MKFLSLILQLEGYAQMQNDNADSNNADDNYAQRTNHDYIGSFGIILNEPKNLKELFTKNFTYQIWLKNVGM